MEGRHLALRALRIQDYELIYEWASTGVVPWQWQGRPVGPEGFQQTLWAGVLAHFIIERLDGRPLGVVTAYSANFHHQHCYLQMGLVPEVRSRGWPLEAGLLAIDYLFTNHNFQKLYGEVVGRAVGHYQSGFGDGFEVEGRLTRHLFVDGQFQDMVIVALHRETWENQLRPVVRRLRTAKGAIADE